MYRMEAVKVDTLLSGEIDCADLERKLTERKDKPAILNVNIGEGQLFWVCNVSSVFGHLLCMLILIGEFFMVTVVLWSECQWCREERRMFSFSIISIVLFVRGLFWQWETLTVKWIFAGTTVKGAVDDLDLVLKTLQNVGYTEDRFYIHVDGALFGLMMPFVKKVSILCCILLQQNVTLEITPQERYSPRKDVGHMVAGTGAR